MAARGPKAKPTHLHVIEGTINATRHADRADEPVSTGHPSRPKKLNKRQTELWDEFIDTAFWLGVHDGPKAHMWCCLQAEFERAPAKMIAGRIAQLRALGSELGLDPASRTRLGGPQRGTKEDKDAEDTAAKYFDD